MNQFGQPPPEPSPGERVNARLENVLFWNAAGERASIPLIVTTRAIRAGEEILIWYGPAYRALRTYPSPFPGAR